MSVAQISAREYGLFVAAAVKSGSAAPTDLFGLCKLCEQLSVGNCEAWAATYDDRIEPTDSDEIEREALNILANPIDLPESHFGPIAYNCIANNGAAFVGRNRVEQGNPIFEMVSELEKRCQKWIDGQRAQSRRLTENAEAFDVVGPLPTMSRADVYAKCRAAGCQRVIVADFMVNESDSQSDYFGGRSVRQVVIGYGKGKRESFSQLRKAAAKFKPTAHLAPGNDRYTVRAVFANDVGAVNGSYYGKGYRSHWHDDNGKQFDTRAEAEAFIAKAGKPHDIGFEGKTGEFEWEIGCESYEHRECWSMGGGNYLSAGGRYSGWQVYSYVIDDGYGTPEQIEVFE